MLPEEFVSSMMRAAVSAPDSRAVIAGDRTASFAELANRARYYAALFRQLGLCPGQRVSYYARSSVDLIAAAAAVFLENAVFTSMHPGFSPTRLAKKLHDCDAAFLLTDRPDCLPENTFEQVHQDAGLFLLARRSPARQENRPDLGAIFYTSGSSGEPKGVAVTPKAMLAAQTAVSDYLSLTAHDVVMSFTTLGSDFGFYNCFIPMNAGAAAVLETELPGRNGDIFNRLELLGVTGLHVFPGVLHALAAAASEETVNTTVRYICSTGQAFPSALLARLRRLFPKAQIFSSYGMTECKRIAFLPDGELEEATGSVGRPLEGLRAYLLDESDAPVLEANQPGELVLAGDQLMEGYWNDTKATRKVFLHDRRGESRLLRTGDVFRRDGARRYWFVGRMDEAFTRNGFQVDPREIERAALTAPGVRDALVVALPHPVEGLQPAIAVTCERTGAEQEAAVRAACTGRLEQHMQPVRYLLLERLPQDASGKTSHRALTEIFLSQAGAI